MNTLRLKNWFGHEHHSRLEAAEAEVNRIVHSEAFWVITGVVAAILIVGFMAVLSRGQYAGNGMPIHLYPYPF